MEPNAKDRAMIDAVIEVNERARNQRGWWRCGITAALSIGALLLVPVDALPQSLRLALAAVGGLGLLAVLFFLSTKSIGRSDTSWWWLWM